METTAVIKKHERRFIRIRRMLQGLMVLIVALILFLQYQNIVHLSKWIWTNH